MRPTQEHFVTCVDFAHLVIRVNFVHFVIIINFQFLHLKFIVQ